MVAAIVNTHTILRAPDNAAGLNSILTVFHVLTVSHNLIRLVYFNGVLMRDSISTLTIQYAEGCMFVIEDAGYAAVFRWKQLWSIRRKPRSGSAIVFEFYGTGVLAWSR
jgi:hypothetical protein